MDSDSATHAELLQLCDSVASELNQESLRSAIADSLMTIASVTPAVVINRDKLTLQDLERLAVATGMLSAVLSHVLPKLRR